MRDYQGRTVVVTGATGELGFAVVERLLREGAACRVPVRNPAGADRLRALGNTRVTIVPGVDLRDPSTVHALYAEAPALWASVHCAGGFASGTLVESSLDDFQRMISINAVSCFACCHAAVRRLLAEPRTAEGAGRIVNVAAMTAVEPARGAGLSAYAASKAVVASLTRTTARETAAEGLLVNAVAPSILDTPANREALPGVDFKTWIAVEQAAEVIAFLASPANRSVTGAIVPLTGRG